MREQPQTQTSLSETSAQLSVLYQKGSETLAFAAEELSRHLRAASPNLACTLRQLGDTEAPICESTSEIHSPAPCGNPVSAHQPDRLAAGVSSTASGSASSCQTPAIRLFCRPFSGCRDRRTDDVFSVSVKNGSGKICGENERSVLLGVYAFLRKIGFRFLLPDQTLIPALSGTEALSAELLVHAPLQHRGVCIEGADALENVLSFIDWLPKLGFNSFFLQFHKPYIFLARWYLHTGNPLSAPEALPDSFYEDCYARIDAALRKRALLCHAVGHGWTCDALGLPSVGWVKAASEPDPDTRRLLAKIDGKRTYVEGIPLNTNLCYAEPEARARFCDSVLRYAKAHPETDFLHIWLADYPNHVCECEACRRTTVSDQYLSLLNEIDRRMTEAGISTKLVFLLYQELLYPPKETQFLNPERFVLMFAPISRTFRRSYPAAFQTVPLPPFHRNRMRLPVTIEENLSYLRGWQTLFSGDSLDYDYPLGRAHYGDFGYQAISRVISDDLKRLKSLSLNGYLSCQELRVFFPNGLPNYVMGYTLLFPDTPFEALLSEYMTAAYGPCAEEISAYLARLSALSDCDYFNGIGPREDSNISARYQALSETLAEFAPRLSALCKEAEEALQAPRGEAASPEARLSGQAPADHTEQDTQASGTFEENSGCIRRNQKLRLFFLRLLCYHSDCITKLCRSLSALSGGDRETAVTEFDAFRRFIRAHEADWQPYLDVYRILEVSGHYTGFPEEDTAAPDAS